MKKENNQVRESSYVFTSSSPGPTDSMLLHMPDTTIWPSAATAAPWAACCCCCCCWASGGVWPVGGMFIVAAAAAAAAAAVAASSRSFLRVAAAAAASGPLYDAPPRALFNPPTATASTIQPGGCNAARRPLPAPTWVSHHRRPGCMVVFTGDIICAVGVQRCKLRVRRRGCRAAGRGRRIVLSCINICLCIY